VSLNSSTADRRPYCGRLCCRMTDALQHSLLILYRRDPHGPQGAVGAGRIRLNNTRVREQYSRSRVVLRSVERLGALLAGLTVVGRSVFDDAAHVSASTVAGSLLVIVVGCGALSSALVSLASSATYLSSRP
jgi:hypothetical protein